MTVRSRLPAAFWCLAITVTAGLAAPVEGQDPAPEVFRGATTLVPVDVRVLDRAGQPVTDLRQDEFIVTENGRAQRIQHFSTQSFTAGRGTGLGSRASRDPRGPARPRTAEGRVFLIVLGNGAFRGPAKARDAIRQFIRERLLPQDLVAVVGWNRTTEFTTNHAAILDVIQRANRAQPDIDTRLKLAQSGLAAIHGGKEMPASLQREVDAVFEGSDRALSMRTTESREGPNAARLRADRDRIVDDLRDAARGDSSGGAEATLDAFVEKHAQSMQDLGKLYAAIDRRSRFNICWATRRATTPRIRRCARFASA